MANEGKLPSWASSKDAQTREKQFNKLEALRNKVAAERARGLQDRVGDPTTNDVDERVAAIIRGEVNTHSPAAKEAEARIDQLRTEQANLVTELDLLRPRYVRATTQRRAHLERSDAWKRNTFGARVPEALGSRRTLAAAIAGLVVLESIMLRRPAESMVRNLFPEWTSVAIPALLVIAAFTLLSSLILGLTGRSWKEHNVSVAYHKIAAESEDASVVPKPSAASPMVWTFAALMSQTILAILRIQAAGSNSSTRGTIVLFSILLLFLAATIVLIEYRVHKPESRTDVTWDEKSIATYLGMWTRAYTHIPQEIATVSRGKLEALKGAAHDYERLAPTITDGGVILGALTKYLGEIDDGLDQIKVPEFGGLPGDDGLKSL